MVSIKWSHNAHKKLKNIYLFISESSLRYAQIQIEDILNAVNRLSLFPFLGKRIPESKHPDQREVVQGQYRIAYRFNQTRKSIFIITILHSRQKDKYG